MLLCQGRGCPRETPCISHAYRRHHHRVFLEANAWNPRGVRGGCIRAFGRVFPAVEVRLIEAVAGFATGVVNSLQGLLFPPLCLP